MQEKVSKQYVEAIKLAARSVQYKNLSVQETIIDAVSNLYIYFKHSGNKDYLETALLHIQAYLELGFPYEKAVDTFDSIFGELGTTKELKFPKRFYFSRQIKLNKTQVRSIIRRWPASPHQKMKIDDVVADIIYKVEHHEMGIYYYQSAIQDEVYELVISEKETFFHDLKRGIFYTFFI